MPNWTLTKVIYSRIKWETMLLKNALTATFVVLVAAIKDVRVHEEPINQKSLVNCIERYTCFFLQGMMFGLLIGVFHVIYPQWHGGTTHWMIVQPMILQPLSTK